MGLKTLSSAINAGQVANMCFFIMSTECWLKGVLFNSWNKNAESAFLIFTSADIDLFLQFHYKQNG